MNTTWLVHAALMLALLLALGLVPRALVAGAGQRLAAGQKQEIKAAKAPVVAAGAEVEYCTDDLKTVLRRVLTNCGLIGGGRRGCQPGELKKVAQISDTDFNTLFKSLNKRAGIALFDQGKEDLDEGGKALAEKLWSEQKGASYFFVVGRASTDGPTELNRALSHKRVNSILFYLQDRFKDPELEQKVGLLWLGEEYAQLGKEFCDWQTSRPGGQCQEDVINRSTILSWIDCRL